MYMVSLSSFRIIGSITADIEATTYTNDSKLHVVCTKEFENGCLNSEQPRLPSKQLVITLNPRHVLSIHELVFDDVLHRLRIISGFSFVQETYVVNSACSGAGALSMSISFIVIRARTTKIIARDICHSSDMGRNLGIKQRYPLAAEVTTLRIRLQNG